MMQHSELAELCRDIEAKRVALPDPVFHLIVFGQHAAGTPGETMRAQDLRRHRNNAGMGAFCYASLAFCCPTALRAAGPSSAAPETASMGAVLGGGPVGLHHVTVDIGRYPWSSIGKLFNSVGGACTAVVIAPDQVLTAAHCLYAFRTQRWLRADAIHFLLGYARGAYSQHVRVERISIGPGYDPTNEVRTAASDWAVMGLGAPLPAHVRPLPVTDALPPTGRTIAIGGFAQDRAYLMTADTHCHLGPTLAGGKLLSHDCAIQHGDSGAPLLIMADGVAKAFGVTVGFLKTEGRRVSIAAPVTTAILPTAQILP